MNKSLLVASFAVLTTSVFGMNHGHPQLNNARSNPISRLSMSVFVEDNLADVNNVTKNNKKAEVSAENAIKTRQIKKGSEALMKAIRNDNVKEVKRIISRYEDVSKMVGFLTLVKQVKKKGVTDEGLEEINGRYQNDILNDNKLLVNMAYGCDTPLLCAIEKGNLEIVKLLIDCGADANAFVENRCVRIESKYMDYTVLSDTPLVCAIRNRNFEVVKLLIDHWANVNKVTDGRPPIHEALICKNNLEVVEYLVDHGADINARDEFGDTLLHEAVSYNNLEVVKFLLDHGANINDQSRNGYTPLLTAANYNNAEIAKYLLERGAVIDVKNNEGETALMRAVKEVYDVDVDLVKCLIDHGANIYAEDNNGNTPYSIVSKRIEKRDYSRGGKEKLLLPILELNSNVDEQSIQAQMERGKKVADRAKRRASNQKNYDDSVESASRLLRTGNITPPKKKKKPNRKFYY